MRPISVACAALACLAVAGVPPARAEVTVEKVAYLNQPNCYRLSNGTVDVVVSTDIGPRVLRYGFVGGDNALGEVPEQVVKTALGEWRPWGGHRLWSAPEHMPRSYSPDNTPVRFAVDGATITLEQPVEPETGIQKTMVVTLDGEGTGVRVQHRLTNRGLWPIEVAVWALTIMAPGGTVIIPQEPYRPHDQALLPVRAASLWAYTDLADPRWRLGPKFIRLRNDAALPEPQKIGVSNRLGWAAYLRRDELFVKRYAWRDGATYPDYGVNTETYTAGAFIELETLGPLERLAPGAAASHEERWQLVRGVAGGDTDADLERALAPHLSSR